MALQRELAERVIPRTTFDVDAIEHVAGVDISVRGDKARAAVCVLTFPALELVETRTAVLPLDFPYVPGLLGFREVPSILAAFEQLDREPDVVLVDGQGYAHPRRCGLACHLGVELDLPTIGCAKSRLIGEHREPGRKRGSRTQLKDRGEVIGCVLRTRDGVKPLYVSIGHRVDLDTAVRLTLRCTPRYRLPETTRAADRAAGLIPL